MDSKTNLEDLKNMKVTWFISERLWIGLLIHQGLSLSFQQIDDDSHVH